MTHEEIAEKLKEILVAADDRNAEKIALVTDDANLMTDLGFTSISLLYMVIAIEESFGIRFDDVGVDDFITFGDVCRYIGEKTK